MLAQDAEAKYGDQRKFAAVLVPLTTLVFPAVAMGMFVLYSFQEDAFWRIVPGTKRARELDEAGGSIPSSPIPRIPLMASSTLMTTTPELIRIPLFSLVMR